MWPGAVTEATWTLQEVLSLMPSGLESLEEMFLSWHRGPELVTFRDYLEKGNPLFHRKWGLDLKGDFEKTKNTPLKRLSITTYKQLSSNLVKSSSTTNCTEALHKLFHPLL